jgi:hypothetical protein
MARLFRDGEARKRQLMELARLAAAPVLSIPVSNEFDITQIAGFGESLPPKPKQGRLRRALIAFAVGALVSASALAVLAYQRESTKEIGPSVAATAALEAPQETKANLRAAEVTPELVADEAATPAIKTPTHAAETETTPPVPEPHVGTRPSKRTRRAPLRSTPPGTVNLVTRGGWAEVFKDGKSLGVTPARLTLPSGRHKLVLKPSGGQSPKRIFITVEPGRTKQVSIPLK